MRKEFGEHFIDAEARFRRHQKPVEFLQAENRVALLFVPPLLASTYVSDNSTGMRAVAKPSTPSIRFAWEQGGGVRWGNAPRVPLARGRAAPLGRPLSTDAHDVAESFSLLMTASFVFSRLSLMYSDFQLADRRINDLATRVDHWRPGAYAGGFYADFVDVNAALFALDPVQGAYASERLERLAARVGITLARVDDIAGSAHWRCVGVVKALIYPWHLAKAVGALFPQPSVQARVTRPRGRTVEIWTAMPNQEAMAMVRRIDAVLTRAPVRRVVGNCLLLPLSP